MSARTRSSRSVDQRQQVEINALKRRVQANATSIIVPGAGFAEAVQDVIGLILTDTARIDFTYNDIGDQISADIVPASIGSTQLQVIPGVAGSYTSANITVDTNGRVITASSGSGGGAHALLSASHSDTVPAAPLRGAIIMGNATPAWDRKLINPIAGTVLVSDGVEADWQTLLRVSTDQHTGTTDVFVFQTSPTLITPLLGTPTSGDLRNCNVFTSTLAGVVPASGGGTVNFLRADGAFAAPSGGGNVSTTLPSTVDAVPIFTSTAGALGNSLISQNSGMVQILDGASGFTAAFDLSSLTGFRTYALPGTLSGTIALTSMIPSGATLSRVNDTNVTMTLGGTPTTALLQATSMTLGWTGQLAVGRGGTGQASANSAFANLSPMTTQGDLITRSATVPVRLGIGASGTILRSNGTDPAWASLSTAGIIGGGGTADVIAKFTPSGVLLGNSLLTESGTTVTMTGTFSITASLVLPVTTATSVGVIRKGSTPVFHDYDSAVDGNLFWGQNAGNFTMSSANKGNYGYGDSALSSLTSGERNAAMGYAAAGGLTIGSHNVAIGSNAGGGVATGDYGVYLGSFADGAGSPTNVVALGYGVIVDADNKVVIGNLPTEDPGGVGTTVVELRGVTSFVYGGITSTLDFAAVSSDTTFGFPDTAGTVWVDRTAGGLSAVDDPYLTWTPDTAGSTGFRAWVNSTSNNFSFNLNNGTGVMTADIQRTGGARWVFSATAGMSPLVTVSGTLTATGVITGASFNKVTITAPATGSTLTIADGKTLTITQNVTFTNGATFTGTNGSTIAFGAGGTILYAAGIGVTVQAFDATLTSIAALGTAADKMLYTTAVDTWAESAITAAGRALIDDADAATQRTTLGTTYAINFGITPSGNFGASATLFFGISQKPTSAAATAQRNKIYFRRAGVIRVAEVFTYSATAGSSENWSWYVRKNDTTDTLIATVGAATNERVWTNTAINISVSAGDYVEIKTVTPAWGTAALNSTMSGYLLVE